MLSKDEYKKVIERTLTLTPDEKIQTRDFVERSYQGDRTALGSLEVIFGVEFKTWGDVRTLESLIFNTMSDSARSEDLSKINQRLELHTVAPLKPSSKISTMRMQAGLTQTELAEKIGVTQKDISRWENGVRNPKVDALKKIADALGCKVDDLI